MDAGLDTGPVLATWRCAIGEQTTTGELQETLSREGATLMVDALARLGRGDASEVTQSDAGVTYAKKITVEDARIDWSNPAAAVLRQIHGLNPAPGAWTMMGEARLKLLRAALVPGGGVPGSVIAAPLIVACGEGALRIDEVQRAGRGVQKSDEFRRGFPVAVGTRFV